MSLFPCLRVLEREVHTHTLAYVLSIAGTNGICDGSDPVGHLRLQKSPFKHKTTGRGAKIHPDCKKLRFGVSYFVVERGLSRVDTPHNLRKSLIAKPRARLFGFSRETEQLVASTRAVNTANWSRPACAGRGIPALLVNSSGWEFVTTTLSRSEAIVLISKSQMECLRCARFFSASTPPRKLPSC